MAVDTLFSGHAIRPVDGEGGTVLPAFILRVLERRCSPQRVLFGVHETDPCISGYDEAFGAQLFADIERRRWRDEEQGVSPRVHHQRVRRTFGTVERGAFDDAGRITLPAMIRRRGRIGTSVLFVGAGSVFEIWDPELARESGGEDLRELVEFADRAERERERESER